jgi:hypothetical protein
MQEILTTWLCATGRHAPQCRGRVISLTQTTVVDCACYCHSQPQYRAA